MTRDEVEIDRIVAGRLYRRIKQLEREGRISPAQAEKLAEENRESFGDWMEKPFNSPWDRYEVDEIGRMDKKLRGSESGGGTTINYNVGDTYNTIEGGGGRPRSYELED